MCITVCLCVTVLFPDETKYRKINAHFVWASKINVPMLAMAFNIKDHGHAPQDFLSDITGMEKLISLAETTTLAREQRAVTAHNATCSKNSTNRRKKMPTEVTFKMLELAMGKK